VKNNEFRSKFKSSGTIVIAAFAVLLIAVALLFFVDSRRDANAQMRVTRSLNNQYSFNNSGSAYYPNTMRPGRYPAYACYPPSMPVQQVASNTLTLPMGVSLAGKGTVLWVTPGSSADLAGIQVGDVINRINGR